MHADVIIVGAGIIGCALAEQLALRGVNVRVIDAAGISEHTSAAGMGHLVALGDDPAQFALALHSLKLWQQRAASLPSRVAYTACGTLWLAADEEEAAHAQEKSQRLHAAGVRCEWLDDAALRAAEPALTRDLLGALRVVDDAVIYPPQAALHFAARAREHGAHFDLHTRVQAVGDGEVVLAGGRRLQAARIVVAAGCASAALVPEAQILPRKGHLLITTRQVPRIHHQLVELGYHKSAHGHDPISVAFNAQPRETGQILIGSSRQFDDLSADLVPDVLTRMLQRAARYLPDLPQWPALRAWTGQRPCTPDNLPYIGRLQRDPGLWLAAGHEGLGITTATGTADVLADLLCDQEPAIDTRAFAPDRKMLTSAAA